MIVNPATRILFRNSKNLTLLKSRTNGYSRTAAEESRLFWEKNDKLKRPMSPHLTIYRLPQPANLSIMHRGTGAAMTAVVFGFGFGSFLWTGKFDKVVEFVRDNVHPHVILTAKIILAFPLCYHALNGVRHLVWDSGRGLKLQTIHKTGYAVVALAFLLSLAIGTL
ncbi:unnamed protein product [Brachionus calyciflorus]|uniref:Succinate dehydrogenase cytochrome b560 subunit, mitochondrial n=1 Tax=Brachionus calyciflorus TaxID=104777 RepID=A0A814MDE6_9BILA|nr:unnamed protein product [Brachionus calyciflorus]